MYNPNEVFQKRQEEGNGTDSIMIFGVKRDSNLIWYLYILSLRTKIKKIDTGDVFIAESEIPAAMIWTGHI